MCPIRFIHRFFNFRKVANSLADEVIEISIDQISYIVEKDQQLKFFYIAVMWYFVIGLVGTLLLYKYAPRLLNW